MLWFEVLLESAFIMTFLIFGCDAANTTFSKYRYTMSRDYAFNAGILIKDTTTRNVPIVCFCKQLCSENPNCTAFSWKPLPNRESGYTCNTTEHDRPFASLSIVEPGASDSRVAIKRVHVDSALKDDRLLYWMAPSKHNFTSAKERCNRIPGFRLGIYKTDKAIEVLKSFVRPQSVDSKAIWVDLERSNTAMETPITDSDELAWKEAHLVWGDGTHPNRSSYTGRNLIKRYREDFMADKVKYCDARLSPVCCGMEHLAFVMNENGTLTRSDGQKHFVLCQGNVIV